MVAAYAVEPLPEGALVPALTGHNVRDRATVGAAVGRVLDQVGRPRRVAIVVPDPVARVSVLRFEQVPARAQDLEQLIRWQIRKAAPFAVDEGQVSFVEGIHSAEGQEFVVSLARRDVIQEYEELCAAAGAHAGIVDIATFNVINTVLAGNRPPADWLLVNVACDYTSIAIMRGSRLIVFRSRGADADGTLADLVHQTAMYYEDRLKGGGFDRVLLAGASTAGARQAAGADHLRRHLEERPGRKVETVDLRGAVGLTDRASAPPTTVDSLAPLVGVLLRGREVTA